MLHPRSAPFELGLAGPDLLREYDSLDNFACDPLRVEFSALARATPNSKAAHCKFNTMEIFNDDDDDDFLKGLPSLEDWPSQDTRQKLQYAATMPHTSFLACSNYFLGEPFALPVPPALERCMVRPRAHEMADALQPPHRQPSTSSCNTAWAASRMSLPAVQRPGLCTGVVPERWEPLALIQGHQPQLRPSEAVTGTQSPTESCPWPWVQETLLTRGQPAQIPIMGGRFLAGAPPAVMRAEVSSPRATMTVETPQMNQPQQPRLLQQTPVRFMCELLHEQSQQQQQEPCLQQQEQQHQHVQQPWLVQQQQQQLPNVQPCLQQLAPAQLQRLPQLQQLQQQTLQPQQRWLRTPRLLDTYFQSGQSVSEEERLMAEILAAPWPSTKMSHDAAAAAFEAAAALASTAAKQMAPPSSITTPVNIACERQSLTECFTVPACGSLCPASTPGEILGASEAPATPLLSPPSPPEQFPLPRRSHGPGMTLVVGQEEVAAARSRSISFPASEPTQMRESESGPTILNHGLGAVAHINSDVTVPQPQQMVLTGFNAGLCGEEDNRANAAAGAAAAPFGDPIQMQHATEQYSRYGAEGVGRERNGNGGGSKDAAANGCRASDGSAAIVTSATDTAPSTATADLHRSGGSRTSGSSRAAGRVTLDALRNMFDLPVQEVVRALGISATDLKRRCRALGIQRWPQRKLMSLRRLAEAVEVDSEISEVQRKEMLERVARNRVEIITDPNAELEAFLKPVRQAHYKRNFVDRRSGSRS